MTPTTSAPTNAEIQRAADILGREIGHTLVFEKTQTDGLRYRFNSIRTADGTELARIEGRRQTLQALGLAIEAVRASKRLTGGA